MSLPRQDTPCATRCEPPILHFDSAIDKNMHHASSELIRLIQCTPLTKGVRIEYGNIRPVPDPQDPSISQSQTVCRPRVKIRWRKVASHLVNVSSVCAQWHTSRACAGTPDNSRGAQRSRDQALRNALGEDGVEDEDGEDCDHESRRDHAHVLLPVAHEEHNA